jgi:hypothetical protein
MYIGVTKDPVERLKKHLREARYERSLHRPVYRWINALLEQNKKPVIQVIASCVDEEWDSLEIQLIAQYRKDYQLLNVADGGNRPKASHEANVRNAIKLNEMRKDRGSPSKITVNKMRLSAYLKNNYSDHANKLRQRMIEAGYQYPHTLGDWRYLT